MQMKQFSGATVDDVLLQVRAELGDDAVILQTKRVVNGGIGGFFGRQGVEVLAAPGLPAEEAEIANREAAASVAVPAPAPQAAPPADEAPAETPSPFRRHLEGRLAAAEEAEAMEPPASGAPASPAAAYARSGAPGARPFAPGDLERSQAILEAARAAVRRAHDGGDDPLLAAVPAEPAEEAEAPFVPAAFVAPAAPPAPVAPPAPAEEIAAIEPPAPVPAPVPVPEPVAPRRAASRRGAPNLDAVHNELVRAGVDERLLDRFMEGFAQGVAPFLEPGDAPRDAVRDYIASRLPVVREWRPTAAGQTLAFVGQSGVGKTSAAACLAGRYRAAGLAVALVAAGEGPHDALEGHARRLDVQLFRAADGPALATLCGTLADRDLVVIDTAGRSHQALGEIEDLAALLGPAEVGEVHLVLPAAAALADLGDVQRRFRLAGVNRLTLTKLDETRFHGNLLNLPMRMGKPLAFLSSGTSVPGSLVPAQGRRVAELLLP